jgi:hypothetical protein
MGDARTTDRRPRNQIVTFGDAAFHVALVGTLPRNRPSDRPNTPTNEEFRSDGARTQRALFGQSGECGILNDRPKILETNPDQVSLHCENPRVVCKGTRLTDRRFQKPRGRERRPVHRFEIHKLVHGVRDSMNDRRGISASRRATTNPSFWEKGGMIWKRRRRRSTQEKPSEDSKNQWASNGNAPQDRRSRKPWQASAENSKTKHKTLRSGVLECYRPETPKSNPFLPCLRHLPTQPIVSSSFERSLGNSPELVGLRHLRAFARGVPSSRPVFGIVGLPLEVELRNLRGVVGGRCWRPRIHFKDFWTAFRDDPCYMSPASGAFDMFVARHSDRHPLVLGTSSDLQGRPRTKPCIFRNLRSVGRARPKAALSPTHLVSGCLPTPNVVSQFLKSSGGPRKPPRSPSQPPTFPEQSDGRTGPFFEWPLRYLKLFPELRPLIRGRRTTPLVFGIFARKWCDCFRNLWAFLVCAPRCSEYAALSFQASPWAASWHSNFLSFFSEYATAAATSLPESSERRSERPRGRLRRPPPPSTRKRRT